MSLNQFCEIVNDNQYTELIGIIMQISILYYSKRHDVHKKMRVYIYKTKKKKLIN